MLLTADLVKDIGFEPVSKVSYSETFLEVYYLNGISIKSFGKDWLTGSGSLSCEDHVIADLKDLIKIICTHERKVGANKVRHIIESVLTPE